MSAQGNKWLVQFTDWAVKVLLVAVAGLLWNMHQAQNEFLRRIQVHDIRITQMEREMAEMRGNMVTIDTLKRVELYMELIMARSGIKEKVDLTSHLRKGEE